ncbi:Uncharacterized protein TCAP_07390 [Tolypocladium capitatum]|uniref:Uncharacterized protein n=1 Tax=Tolypocladium capitatum TaxID=45235 RepID=A0A2K3PYW4_9HYPO|nr:Uncharacterized protein TCAP_07390 [Tolypocladium capitatum]
MRPESTSMASVAACRCEAESCWLKSMRRFSSICAARLMGSETLPSEVRRGFGRVYHGCCRTCGKPNRFSGSTDIMPRSRESASGGTLLQSASVLRPDVRMYSLNSQLPGDGSSHGVFPTSRTKRMTPHDHRSTKSGEYLAEPGDFSSGLAQARISGAM